MSAFWEQTAPADERRPHRAAEATPPPRPPVPFTPAAFDVVLARHASWGTDASADLVRRLGGQPAIGPSRAVGRPDRRVDRRSR
ncbi:hypothetical protein [Actinokineospora inagensis]|uniref:hypothetical protein n=1 Tax=Actinokineospora inagensis TaxID=103730 RepID=UPI00041ADB47|nr:hypothetical protein [Actinokineospora inagensis]